jgi:multidrug efflux pump subunit AcrA (membrane-fusion protein)
MKIFTIAVSAIALLVALAAIGCRTSVAADPAVGSVHNPVLAVSATRALVRSMRQQLTLLGTTVALRHLMLRAPTAGRVLGLELRSGERVRRGEVVGRIINRAEEAAQASAEIIQTHDPTQSTVLEHSVERNTSGTGVAVIAPEAGIVAQRLVSSGQIVNELDPLADLIDPASVYVEAQVQIEDLSAIEPGMDATVTSSLNPRALYSARVVALSPSFSTGGTISLVRVAFVGRDKIWEAGATGEVRVKTKYAPEAIAIPANALFQDVERGGFYVFTVGRDDRAHRVTVTVGIHDADRVQLTSGVKPGELVITSGGYALSDGLPVRVVAGGAS